MRKMHYALEEKRQELSWHVDNQVEKKLGNYITKVPNS